MLEFLEIWDHWLFYAINSRMTRPWLDQFMPAITDLHKEPLVIYAIFPIILLLWIYTKKKQAIKLIVGLALCIGCIDSINHRFLKSTFKRDRPPLRLQTTVLRANHHGGYSFPSNHAANNFAAATFLSLSYPFITPFAFSMAALIAYSRVYVGVHFPSDVFIGGLWASLFSWVFFLAWRKLLKTHKVKRYRKKPPLSTYKKSQPK